MPAEAPYTLLTERAEREHRASSFWADLAAVWGKHGIADVLTSAGERLNTGVPAGLQLAVVALALLDDDALNDIGVMRTEQERTALGKVVEAYYIKEVPPPSDVRKTVQRALVLAALHAPTASVAS